MGGYGNDFDGLMDIIKDKLNSGTIDEKYVSLCMQSLDDISAKVNENASQEVYNWAVDALYVILNELKQLEQTENDNDYSASIKKEENDLAKFMETVIFNLNELNNERTSQKTVANKKKMLGELKCLRNDIKKLNKDIRLTRLKVISCLLTLSLLISVPISTFFGIKKRTEYKTVYPTHETIYDTETSYEYDMEYYHGAPVVGNVLSYNNENLEFEHVGDMGYVINEDGYYNCYYKIIEKTPWTIQNREAIREVRTCIVAVNEIGNVVDLDTFDDLYARYNGTTEKEIILKSEVPRSDRKFYADEENKERNTYEVIRYDQDLNEPITIAIPNDYRDVYVILFSELLIWLCIVECSRGLITETMIKSLKRISDDKRLTKAQKIKLDKLYNSYVSLFPPVKEKKKRRTKNK